jgi:Co/Zn/Cd efflux system component
MDPVMGILGAILITRWSFHLLHDTSGVLLDHQSLNLAGDIKHIIENECTKISDLHVWAIGPNMHAAIVAIVSDTPAQPQDYRQQIQSQNPSLVHVSIELNTYSN